jgi:hypothetical protein
MTYYKIQQMEICYDPKRTNGLYFAKVSVKAAKNYEDFFDPHKPSRVEDLEVILNGPGTNKARRKIGFQLKSKGMDLNIRNDNITPLKH